MDLNNIERNQLDYFLTDVLPTELSDRFTYIYFYKYLISKNKDIQSMIRHQIKAKNDNNSDILFVRTVASFYTSVCIGPHL